MDGCCCDDPCFGADIVGAAAGATTALLLISSKVEIKTTDLGEHMYMLEGQGGNITVAVAKDGYHVDGQYAPLQRQDRRHCTVSNQPIKYLINTHFHGDHVGGNGPSPRTAPR